jgi:hypothetical protein
MSLFHPSRRRSLEEAEGEIVSLYSPQFGSWYFTAVILAVGLLGSDSNSSSGASLIAKILDVAREDYSGRKQLDWLLNRWRETSAAPIQTAGVQSVWLTQSN